MEKRIGNKLRELRESRQLSQEYLAELLGISQSTYCKIENDQVRINADRIYELSLLYNISISEFWGAIAKEINDTVHFTPFNHQNQLENPYPEQKAETEKIEKYVRFLKEKIRVLEAQIELFRKEKDFTDM